MSEAKMPLTPEMREHYIRLIKKIWPGVAMNRYSASDVTDEVVDTMDFVLNEIVECSRSMSVVEEVYTSFYMPFTINKWRKLVKETLSVVEAWLDAVEENKVYLSCVVTAARNWRSHVEMQLMGL